MKGHATVVKPEVDPSRRSLDGMGDHLAHTFELRPLAHRQDAVGN